MHDSATLKLVVLVVALMFTASVVSLAAKRLRFPYTILLVIIGLLLGRAAVSIEPLHFLLSFRLTPDAVLFVFLPVLLFESAFNLDARRLIKNIAPIAMLAVPALLVSMAVVGGIVHVAFALPLGVALMFGALISATDPVAVVALFKEIGAPKRLNILVEGESLFNDGTALVVFTLLIGILKTGTFTGATLLGGIVSFFTVAAGGIALGIALGVAFSKLISRVYEDRFVEITLTTILAHSSFLLAEHFHVSGVMATVAAGLTMGSYGRTKISPAVHEHLEAFWEYFAFICNSLIFLLVGLSIEAASLMENFKAILIAAAAVLVGRGLAVYGTMPVVTALFKRVEHVSMSFRTVIAWGGLRGALAIVMALSIPHDLPQRDFLMTLTLGVVLFSLLINGLTIKPLMGTLGLGRYSAAEDLERTQAMLSVKKTTHALLSSFALEKELNAGSSEHVAHEYEHEIARLEAELRRLHGSLPEAGEEEVAMSHCLLLEKQQYMRLFEEGLLNEDKLRDMLTAIQRQLDRIKEGREVYLPGRPPLAKRVEAALENFPPLRPMMGRLKSERLAATYEVERARAIASQEILTEISRMQGQGTLSGKAFEAVRELYSSLHQKAHKRLDAINAGYPEYVEKADYGILYRYSLNQELRKYRELHGAGAIPEKAFGELEGSLVHRLRSMKMRPVKELRLSPERLLKNVPFLSLLPEAALKDLAAHCSARSFLRGESVVEEGHEGASLFIVGRGEVEVTHKREGGEEPLARMRAGEFFGETALLHPQPRTATVRAATPCTLIELRRNDIMPLIRKYESLGKALENAYRTHVLNDLLAHVPELHALDAGKRDYLASLMRQKRYTEGQSLCMAGQEARYMFIIKSGNVSLSRRDEQVAILVGGDNYLEHAEAYGATLRALRDTEAYVLELSRLNL